MTDTTEHLPTLAHLQIPTRDELRTMVLAMARAEERRRIARLIQDAAGGPVLMATRDALLALREQVLALEDEP